MRRLFDDKGHQRASRANSATEPSRMTALVSLTHGPFDVFHGLATLAMPLRTASSIPVVELAITSIVLAIDMVVLLLRFCEARLTAGGASRRGSRLATRHPSACDFVHTLHDFGGLPNEHENDGSQDQEVDQHGDELAPAEHGDTTRLEVDVTAGVALNLRGLGQGP